VKKLIDVACPGCGTRKADVWTDALPTCSCGAEMERCWAFVKAPGITPNGTRPEVGCDVSAPSKVDTKAIAAETKAEIEQKWLRYSDEKIAEQHVSREINEAAGIADAQGNEKKIEMPAPIMFEKPIPAASAAM
jgi:hypothetical protein